MALIVELFGPPGSGKTTFSIALAARLRARGLEVGVHLSSRPGEGEIGGSPAGKVSRIARPLWELIAAGVSGPSCQDAGAASLAPLLARVGRFREIRLRQYLFRLASAWGKARASAGVVVFDQ